MIEIEHAPVPACVNVLRTCPPVVSEAVLARQLLLSAHDNANDPLPALPELWPTDSHSAVVSTTHAPVAFHWMVAFPEAALTDSGAEDMVTFLPAGIALNHAFMSCQRGTMEVVRAADMREAMASLVVCFKQTDGY